MPEGAVHTDSGSAVSAQKMTSAFHEPYARLSLTALAALFTLSETPNIIADFRIAKKDVRHGIVSNRSSVSTRRM